jgi:hypothetical protein
MSLYVCIANCSAPPVLDSDEDDVLVQDVVWLVLGGRAAGEVSPVDPDDNGPVLGDHQVSGEYRYCMDSG